MNDYIFPTQDSLFLLNEVLDINAHCASIGKEDINSDLISAIIEEATKLGKDLFGPLNRIGDTKGAEIVGNVVFAPPGFSEAYRTFIDNGWLSLTEDEEAGGQGLPLAVGRVVDEIWNGSNMSFGLCPMLSQGAIEAIKAHGSSELKENYLPNMVSGEWTGTMNLTEPQAGSDLSLLRTKAVPKDGHFLITGQKIFITWGEHDMAENIIHLVLARLPDAPPGVKGISLFLVPKYLLDGDGNIGELNDVSCTSIEHKLGIHGSPTCSMSFGDKEGAIGYLVGEPNKGLACMFTMMNHARQAVGVQGLAISERSFQHALHYAKDRKQGKNSTSPLVEIGHHPDVKRMLLMMKSGVSAMRHLAYIAGFDMDKLHHASEELLTTKLSGRVGLFTPVIKGWMTELAQEITSLGIQICGGMGFVEETGIAQHYRDARILPIYEGTTGIQGQDFTFRKIIANEGADVFTLLCEIENDLHTFKEYDNNLADIKKGLQEAVEYATEAVEHLLKTRDDVEAVSAHSTNMMMMFGYILGGWGIAKEANVASVMLDSDKYPQEFLNAKIISSGFYAKHYLPRAKALCSSVVSDPSSINDMDLSYF